jgi:hypothetical protein
MPTINLEVESYRASIRLMDNSRGYLELFPPADFHGGRHPVNILFLAQARVPFEAFVEGSDPFSYIYYVFTTHQALFNGLLEILEREGPKHVSLEQDRDIPVAVGGYTIPITSIAIGTDGVSVLPLVTINLAQEKFFKR